MLFSLFSAYHSYNLQSRFSVVASVLLVRVQTHHSIKTFLNKKKRTDVCLNGFLIFIMSSLPLSPFYFHKLKYQTHMINSMTRSLYYHNYYYPFSPFIHIIQCFGAENIKAEEKVWATYLVL